MRKSFWWIVLIAVLVAAGCARTEKREEPAPPRQVVTVAVSAYPVAWLVESIGGDRVRTVQLISAASDLHESELDPAAVAALGSANLVVVLGGALQPSIDGAISTQGVDDARVLRILDRLQEEGVVERPPAQGRTAVILIGPYHPEKEGAVGGDGVDPGLIHFWVDPVSMAKAASFITSALSEVSPQDRTYFEERQADLDARLQNLNQAYSSTIEKCRSRTLITYHDAYHALGKRYGLEEVYVTGPDPEVEPRPSDIQAAVEAARRSGARAVFSDPEAGKEAMEQVAREAGVSVEMLDPVELREAGREYDTRMYSNLSKIEAALNCR